MKEKNENTQITDAEKDMKRLIDDADYLHAQAISLCGERNVSTHDVASILQKMGYVLKEVVKRVSDIQESDAPLASDSKNAHQTREPVMHQYGVTDIDIEDATSEILDEICIPVSLIGYEYIIDVVKNLIDDPTLGRKRLVGEVYPAIAKMVGSNDPNNIERGIRHAIDVGFQNMNIETQRKYFGNSISPRKGKATNMHFLTVIVKTVRRQLYGF